MADSMSEVWDKCSAIDPYSAFDIKTGHRDGLDYVEHMAAHREMMRLYPDYSWTFDPLEVINDTVLVTIHMTVAGHTRSERLHVHQAGRAVKHPTAGDIQRTMQRAKVKAMALFGLGYQLWVNEEQTVSADPDPAPAPAPSKRKREAVDKEAADLWSHCLETAKEKQHNSTSAALDALFDRYTNALRSSGCAVTDAALKKQRTELFKIYGMAT